MIHRPINRRRISLVRHGRHQVLQIPRELELAGCEVIISKEGNRLIIEPFPTKERLLTTLESLKPVTETFPTIDDIAATDRAVF